MSTEHFEIFGEVFWLHSKWRLVSICSNEGRFWCSEFVWLWTHCPCWDYDQQFAPVLEPGSRIARRGLISSKWYQIGTHKGVQYPSLKYYSLSLPQTSCQNIILRPLDICRPQLIRC